MDYPLEVKLGQMVMVGFRGAERAEYAEFLKQLRRCRLGGVWLTDDESPMGRTLGNIQSPEQVRRMTTDLQKTADIPLFIAVDGEGGQVIRLKKRYGFPTFHSAQYLGAKDNISLTRSQAEQLAATLRECGINFNFAPVLDVNKNPANPIIGQRERSFSSDPCAVARHAGAIIEEHHKQGILCAGKHFPGHGSSLTDSHEGLVDITDTWGEDELLPYEHLIREGLLDAVLSAHVFLRQIDSRFPATLSEGIITGILRGRMGFGGVVLTDDLNMGAIQHYYSLEQSIESCVKAGVDIILHANADRYDPEIAPRTIAILRTLVESGRLSIERVDAAFQRIIALKGKYGWV